MWDSVIDTDAQGCSSV